MDNFSFARRTYWPRQTNSYNQALEDLQAQGISLIDLTVSNPTSCGFQYPSKLLEDLNSPRNFQYQPDACGMKEARQAVAKYYAAQKVNISADHIILTASTSEAYSFIMRLLVNPGEKVLIPRPSYPLFQFLLEINDVAFDYYPLLYDGQWRLDIEALKILVRENKPKAIILVNPNNPTGSFISRTELNALNEICQEHQMAIISDEVFFDYGLEKGDYVSCAGNHSVLTFTLGGLSKTMALPQMKCAWIFASGPDAILQEALSRLEIITDTYLSVNTPVQNALGVWFDHVPVIQLQIMDRLRKNSLWLKENLDKHAELLSFQGGWYATLRIPATKSEEEWVLEFLKEDHVCVYPGYFFDFHKEAYIVLSLLPKEADFQEAMRRIFRKISQ